MFENMSNEICKYCSKEFQYVGSRKRKYCSVDCFRKMPKAFSHMTLTKEECVDLYFNKKLSFYKIESLTGVPVNSLRYWFIKWELTPRNLSEAQSGALNHSYKDGLKDNIARAYIRDNKECKICQYKRIVNVHHIKPKCEGGTDELRNLITLCPNCHSLVHNNIIKIFTINKWEDSGKISFRNTI